MEDPGRPIPASACRPEGPTADQLGSKRTVLYSGPRPLAAVTERRGQVFVADTQDGILRLGEGKTEFERVVALGVGEFLVADLNLYWSREKGLWRAGLNAIDATPDPVAAQLGHEIALLRYDGTHLYFADPMARGAYRVPLMGGALETIASGSDVRDQVVEAGYLYYAMADGWLLSWTTPSGLGEGASKRVLRVVVAGGAMPVPVSPAALSEPPAIAAAGELVYWADDFELVKSEDASARSSLAIAGPRASGRPGRVVRLELVDERLYFTDDGGNLGWTALDGKSCGLIVKNASLSGSDIAADGEAAYLTIANGAVHELWRISVQ